MLYSNIQRCQEAVVPRGKFAEIAVTNLLMIPYPTSLQDSGGRKVLQKMVTVAQFFDESSNCLFSIHK